MSRQEVAHVRNVPGHVILRAGIEIRLAAIHRRRNALILQPQRPPGFVVVLRRDLAGKNFPAPLVDQQSEGQERDFVQRLLQQQPECRRFRRNFVEQADLLQIFRRDGQRDGIADGLMKSVIGAVLETETAGS